MMSTLIIGAAGAVGKQLCAALSKRCSRVIAVDRSPLMPKILKETAGVLEPNVDIRDVEALRALFGRHHREVETVWNLASPLSVETAINPSAARAVTIGGMRNVLGVMREFGLRKICFTDSIGSFGAQAPRSECTARWLTENPLQDPGSDYGRQKGGCRELLAEFAAVHGGDSRFAVLPGVLHRESMWGGGTTEYALEALEAASRNETYTCPISPGTTLPMIFADDLLNGLLALQDADESSLLEPGHGYAIPGLSFTPCDLFDEIRQHVPGFKVRVSIDETMNKFANLWPDSLSTVEPCRDLKYSPKVTLTDMVESVLLSHAERNTQTETTFRTVDLDGNGTLEREELQQYLVKICGDDPRGTKKCKELFGLCSDLVDCVFDEMDLNSDGRISLQEFQTWSKSNALNNIIEDWSERRRLTL